MAIMLPAKNNAVNTRFFKKSGCSILQEAVGYCHFMYYEKPINCLLY